MPGVAGVSAPNDGALVQEVAARVDRYRDRLTCVVGPVPLLLSAEDDQLSSNFNISEPDY